MAKPNWSYGTTLEATPISASEARALVSLYFVDYRLLCLVEPVRLVDSELATHAMVHGQTALVVTLSREDDSVRLTVRDASDWVTNHGPDQVLQAGGRGLRIVNVLSRDWGVITAAGSKTAWGPVRHAAREVGVTFIDAGAGAVGRQRRRPASMTDETPDAGVAEHAVNARRILAAAERRDAISDACDAAAEQRERELDLTEMLNADATYGDHWAERREAALTRLHAKEDRAASRQDRTSLTQGLLQQGP